MALNVGGKTGFLQRALYLGLRDINDRPDSVLHKVYRTLLLSGRRVVSLVTRKPVAWIAQLQSARWLDGRRLEITGFAFERGIGFPDAPPRTRVWLQGPDGLRIEAAVEPHHEAAANARTKDSDYDYANTGFRAVFDLSALFAAPGVRLHAEISVKGGRRTRSGGFEKRFNSGSARFPSTRLRDGVQVVPGWDAKAGLVVDSRKVAAQAVAVRFAGRRVAVTVSGKGIVAGRLVNESEAIELDAEPDVDGRVLLTGEVPAAPAAETTGEGRIAEDVDGHHGWLPHSWYRVQVVDKGGRARPVACQLPERELDGGGELTGFPMAGGLCIRDTPRSLLVDEAEYDAEELRVVVRGRVRGDSDGVTLSFVGPHQTLPVEWRRLDGDRFEAVATLMTSTWGRPPLPPKTGGYTLRAATAQGDWFWIGTDQDMIEGLGVEISDRLFRCRFGVDAARRLVFRVKLPRTDGELGFYHQRVLEENYRKTTFEPEDSIFFESFYGRSSACNPRALDALVAAEHPGITRYWGIVDNSVGVPEGAIPVVYNTKAWWDARGRSRWVIANDWLRKKFKHQPHQVVLQTWHGSMFKRIGMDRPGFDKVQELLLVRERDNWDLLLSQNRHSSDIFRSSYGWTAPLLEEGYPRNDALTGGDGRGIRDLLGIPHDHTVVLYAPTWRDDQEKAQLLLDVAALTAELGDGYTVLLRGHTRTHDISESVTATNLLDVTTYPEITELFLASDILITDYSSVMFDFSVTGRPMIFFVPDLDDYRDSIRGVYFDLEAVAPGPVLYTQELVAPAIGSAAADREAIYAEKYDEWQARFNPHDDGNSGRRVLAALFATKPPRLSGPAGK